ncbi:MAG: FecR domain-containing protein [Deltaproteobacteria bacterium]|nr:FecR domain-containing protein [Deltaproteobacteria bacterium]
MSTPKIALGFVVALVVGGGAGLGLNLAAGGLVAVPAPNAGQAMWDPPLTVTSVTGEVEALGREATWRSVRAGDLLPRPIAIRTRGFGSEVQLSFRGTEVQAGHDAELVLGAAGIETWLQLDAGRVLVVRKARPLTVAIPARGLEISGTSYAVRVVDKKVTLAVLDGEAGVKRGPDAPVTFGRAREVVITEKQMAPLVIEPKLELAITGVTRIGKKATIAGKTSPLAELFLDRGGGFEQLVLNAAGTFTFEIEANEVPAGALVAVDTLGRRAEPNRPSPSLEELLRTMGAPAPTARAEAPAPPPSEPPAAAPPPKVDPPPPPPAEPTPNQEVAPPPPKAEVKAPSPKPEAKVPAPKPEAKAPPTKSPPPVKAPPKAPAPGPSLPNEPPAAKVPGPKVSADEVTDDEAEEEPPARPADPPPPPAKPAPKESADDEGAIDEDQL